MAEEAKNNSSEAKIPTDYANENEAVRVVRVLAESQGARSEREKKWLCFIIIILILCNIAQYAIHAYERSTYDYAVAEIDLSTDGGGHANYVGNDGDINNYGENKSEDHNEEA